MSESRTTKEGIVNYQTHMISYSYIFTIQNAYQQEHNWTYTAQKTFFSFIMSFFTNPFKNIMDISHVQHKADF